MIIEFLIFCLERGRHVRFSAFAAAAEDFADVAVRAPLVAA